MLQEAEAFEASEQGVGPVGLACAFASVRNARPHVPVYKLERRAYGAFERDAPLLFDRALRPVRLEQREARRFLYVRMSRQRHAA